MGEQKTIGPWRIGEVVRNRAISADTLRYYERIGLLPLIKRTPGGLRVYSERDLSRLDFVQRAKSISISLDEIRVLLRLRSDPRNAPLDAQSLANEKLAVIETQIGVLHTLRRELRQLIGARRATIEAAVSDPKKETANKGPSRREKLVRIQPNRNNTQSIR